MLSNYKRLMRAEQYILLFRSCFYQKLEYIILVGAMQMSEKVWESEKISNYPGAGMSTGSRLTASFQEHAKQLGLEMTDKMVTMVGRTGDHYMLLADLAEKVYLYTSYRNPKHDLPNVRACWEYNL